MSATRLSPKVAGIRQRFAGCGLFFALVATLVLPPFGTGEVFAQTKSGDKERIPEAVELTGNELVTRDGVQLKATFYGSIKGKDAEPVILLHMYKGDRTEYATLAKQLQEAGHAVLDPDLRGHGESTTQLIGPNRTRELDAAKLRPDDFNRMVKYDMETLKAFLMTNFKQ